MSVTPARALDMQEFGVRVNQDGPPPLWEGGNFEEAGEPIAPSTNGKPAIPADLDVTIDDFYAFMPDHKYIFVPTRDMWPATSVNARLESVAVDGQQIKPAAWLDANRPVEQMVWAPGEEMIIRDRLIDDGGWVKRPGISCFNLYRPPQVRGGDALCADLWVNHVFKIFPSDAAHIIGWLAHRVQRPGEKINHALVLGGGQGIGKDTLLEPVKYAVGAWNFTEVSPTHIVGRFNSFVKSVLLRVSEARDLGEVDRYSFYEHMKVYTAAPPDVLRCDEKHLREHAVLNVCGVVITTNHKTDGIYLPADDRRHYVAWSDCTAADFDAGYWKDIWSWYRAGGLADVAAYLAGYDLRHFDPKAPPRKTKAFWDIVDANRAPEDAELADVLEKLGNPEATTLAELAARADSSFAEYLRDRRNRRQIPHRLEAAGYVKVRNDAASDGLWKVDGARQAVFARHDLSLRDQLAAAARLVEASRV